MFFFKILLVGSICITSCTQSIIGGSENKGKNLPSSTEQAAQDYDAVLNGNKPTYAKDDPKLGPAADGGTTYYRGDGYRLVIQKAIEEKNGVTVYHYGPILEFDAAGNKKFNKENLKYYTIEEMEKFLKY